MGMEGLEQKCQRRRRKRLSRGAVENDDEFADDAQQWATRERLRRHRLRLLWAQRYGADRIAGLQLQAFDGETVDDQAVAHLARRGGGDAAVFQATVVDQPHGSLIVRGAMVSSSSWLSRTLRMLETGDSITGPASKMSM